MTERRAAAAEERIKPASQAEEDRRKNQARAQRNDEGVHDQLARRVRLPGAMGGGVSSAEVICSSITIGNTSARPASGSVPSLPT